VLRNKKKKPRACSLPRIYGIKNGRDGVACAAGVSDDMIVGFIINSMGV
jgi:hypothetical protein